MSDQVEEFLEHYGVKGMKWGVRRKATRSLSEEEIGNRKARRKLVATAAVVGGLQFGPEIASVAVKSLNSAVLAKQASNGAKAAARMMSDSRGLTNYQTIQSTYNPAKDLWE